MPGNAAISTVCIKYVKDIPYFHVPVSIADDWYALGPFMNAPADRVPMIYFPAGHGAGRVRVYQQGLYKLVFIQPRVKP